MVKDDLILCGFFFFILKGKGHTVLPWQQGPGEREAGSNPWAEFNFFSKKFSKFCLNAGRTKGDNSDCFKFSSEALSAKPLSFPSYFGDMKVPGGYFQPNMKAPFFSSREKLFDWEFFFSVYGPRNVPSFRPHAKPSLFTCIPWRGLTRLSITQQHLGVCTKPLQGWED